ncbi:unnamed protein product [Rhizophagus irregularis]|nr:unnamed protein product [Rhizophagus irregularis]
MCRSTLRCLRCTHYDFGIDHVTYRSDLLIDNLFFLNSIKKKIFTYEPPDFVSPVHRFIRQLLGIRRTVLYRQISDVQLWTSDVNFSDSGDVGIFFCRY